MANRLYQMLPALFLVFLIFPTFAEAEDYLFHGQGPTVASTRLRYQSPGLSVDLDVGLWAHPLPMDFDEDGDNDLLVACWDVPYNGLYFFENRTGDVKYPVFKPGIRLDKGMPSRMAASAESVYVVADHSKIGRTALARFGNVVNWNGLITDSGIKRTLATTLKRAGVKLYKAPGKKGKQ